MEKLIEVIKKIANKYIDKVNLVIKKNSLTLEYFVYKNGKRYLYKAMQINEDKDKLKVIIFPEKIRKEVDIAGLEDIILILDKQSQFIEYTKNLNISEDCKVEKSVKRINGGDSGHFRKK